MDIDILTGRSREIQAPLDSEGSMRPTYRHADLLGLPELFVVSVFVCVCVHARVNDTGAKNEKCSGGPRKTRGGSAGTRSDPYAVVVFAGI